MKHAPPPENLPVMPEDKAKTPDVAPEDVHFRPSASGDTLKATQTEEAAQGGGSGPAPRSLQPNDSDMTQTKRRPIRAPDDLLNVDDVAAAALARSDPGLLVKSDPPLAISWCGDPDRRCAKEAPLFDLPPLVPT